MLTLTSETCLLRRIELRKKKTTTPGSLVQKIFRIGSRRISNKCSPFRKKFVSRKNPKVEIGRKISSFQQELVKLTQDEEILSVAKGYVIPFLKVPVQRTVPKKVTTSKTQELLIDQEIMEMLDKAAIKQVASQFPDKFLRNILLVKKRMGEIVLV